QVFARIPEMPQTTDEQWPWTRGHGRGTAAQLAGMHHALAGGRFRPRQALPIAHGHLERALAPLTPEGADGVGFKGGSLPRTLNLGLSVRWQDGRTGVLALMLSGVSDADLGDPATDALRLDRKSTRLNSSHVKISYAVFCLKKKMITENITSVQSS